MSALTESLNLDPRALPWWAGGVVPALVPSACLSRPLLDAFAQGMADEGLPLQRHRLRYDRRYAFERLAAAHCASDPGLRLLAMRLFELFQTGP